MFSLNLRKANPKPSRHKRSLIERSARLFDVRSIESMNPTMQTEKPKISPTGREILDFLRSRGGISSVGLIGANRSTTIRHLRRLEALGLIECVEPPAKSRRTSDYIGIEGFASHCGVWRLPVEEKIRTCSFCNFTAPYRDFPDGSICYLGICACAPCLETDKAREFRELLEKESLAVTG